MQAILTVDVEADGAWDYASTSRVTVENLRRLPRFQSLCDHFGMPPTYLCTYEVASSPEFEMLVKWQREGRAEIGAHLHPWTNPPFTSDGVDVFDPVEYPGYPSELSPARFRDKLARLSDVIGERSGRWPTSYRAGRWGMSVAQIPVLVELGYIVDCSVTPLVDRRRFPGVRAPGPDFRHAPVTPYRLSTNDMCTPGDSPLLEVPVTIVQPRAWLRQSPLARELYRLLKRVKGAGLLNRLTRTEPLWLRPYSDYSEELILEAVAVVRELGLPVAEMMLHSSELLPGGSETTLTHASVEDVFTKLELMLEALARGGAVGIRLSDFARGHLAQAAA